MRRNRLLVCVAMAACLVLIAGCFPGARPEPIRPAGLFMGLWHGWIAPLSLIVGIFDPGIRIYEVNNTGWLYDLGFYMAIISGFGGISFSRRKGRRHP